MNDITIFTYENTNIRTTTTEDGTPLFCANDVAATLGYTRPAKAVLDHCKGSHFGNPLRPQVESSRFDSSPRRASTASSSAHASPKPRRSSAGSLTKSCPPSASTEKGKHNEPDHSLYLRR